MVNNLYSILDVHQGFGMPVCQDNDAIAMRNFENACCDKSNIFYTHSSDFSLWCIGTFDTDTGIVESCTQRKICNAFDFVSRIDEK